MDAASDPPPPPSSSSPPLPLPAVSLIVPVYDEEGNLEPLHAAILTAMRQTDLVYEVVYVNDGSQDASGAILDGIAARDPLARVVHFVRNYGQTAALTAGIRHARAPILVTLDADLQNDPADIPAMLARLTSDTDTVDVVCGWRRDRQDAFWTRTLPSRAANWLISRLSNVYLHDYGCTLRVYKREFIEEIPLYGEMHRFIPIYVTWAGARLVEVPVRHHPRTRGQSKYGLSRIPKVLLDLTTLKFLRDFFVTPIYFFGWAGILMSLLGMLCLAAALPLWLWGPPALAASMTVLGPLLCTLGVVEVTLGIIAEVLIRMHYELQSKPPYRVGRLANFSPPPAPLSSEG